MLVFANRLYSILSWNNLLGAWEGAKVLPWAPSGAPVPYTICIVCVQSVVIIGYNYYVIFYIFNDNLQKELVPVY